MKIDVFDSADAVARQAAKMIASAARAAVTERGRFVMAVSGGKTPWIMLSALTAEDVPWPSFYIAQVDERIAPAGDADRNFTQLQASFLDKVTLRPEQILAMPVEMSDASAAAANYAKTLAIVAGTPPVLDLIHLGLGPDGHTASLVPGDAVLDVSDRDVAISGVYQNRRRMTLTYPLINRARQILWLVTGGEKAEQLVRLRDADASIPGGRVNQQNAVVLADQPAAARLTQRP